MTLNEQMNLPNQLTIARIIMVPLFIIAALTDTHFGNVVGMWLFVIAAVTDFVDGFIARRYDMITPLGKILDPVADKVLVMSALVILVELGRIEGWVVIVLLSREFVIGALRDYASSNGIVIAAGYSGKVKTALQMTAIGFLVYHDPLFRLDIYGMGLLMIYLSVLVSIWSAVVYYWEFFRTTHEQTP